jgi:hypothetical protein
VLVGLQEGLALHHVVRALDIAVPAISSVAEEICMSVCNTDVRSDSTQVYPSNTTQHYIAALPLPLLLGGALVVG